MATLRQPVPTGGLLAGRMARVTEVIDLAGLGNDFGAVAPERMRAAIARGNAVHRAAELIDDGDLDDASVPEHLQGYVGAYRDFCALVGYRPIATEIDLVHPLGFAGRPDKIGWIGGARFLVDLKTPLVVNPGPLLLQLAAYLHAWPHTFPTEALSGAACLQLAPNRTFKWRRHTLDVAWGTFCSALAMLQGCASREQLAAIDAWAARYPN